MQPLAFTSTVMLKDILRGSPLLLFRVSIAAVVMGWGGCAIKAPVQQPDLSQEPIDAVEEQIPLDPKEKLFQLERYGPDPLPETGDDPAPQIQARERLQILEERSEELKEQEIQELSPQDKARRRILELEEGTLQTELPEENGEPSFIEKVFGMFKGERVERVESRDRARQLLGVYAQAFGIYDEILGVVKPAPRYLARLLGLPDWLILNGEHRTRYENMNGQFRSGLRTVDEQLFWRTRLVFGIQEILDPFRFTVELQDSRNFFAKTNANVNFNHVNELDIQRLHLDLVTPNFLGTGMPSELNVGRVNMDLGHGERARWIARNNYRNATNAYDGVHWSLGEKQGFHAHSFAVWFVERLLDDRDRWFNNNESFFWGTFMLLPPLIPDIPWLRTELIYLGHTSRQAHREFNMLGYRLLKEGGVGEWEFEIESEYQFGNISRFATFAQFYHGEVGYTFDLPWKPQFLFRFDYSSVGFDELYGRRSFELHPTGIFGPFQRTNFAYPGYRVLVRPTDRFYMFVQHRWAWLADPSGPWVGTGLIDPTGQSGNFIGQTIELRARWRVLKDLFLQAGYVHFNLGPFARNAPGSPADRDINYFYFWTEFMF